jgi:alpha-mannosidase
LLRSPKNPDPEADIGHHSVHFALFPHQGTFQEGEVIQEGYAFNEPLIARPVALQNGQPTQRSLISLTKKSIVLETLKKSEDSNAIVVRLYEAYGGKRTTVSIALTFHRPRTISS